MDVATVVLAVSTTVIPGAKKKTKRSSLFRTLSQKDKQEDIPQITGKTLSQKEEEDLPQIPGMSKTELLDWQELQGVPQPETRLPVYEGQRDEKVRHQHILCTLSSMPGPAF